VAFGDLTPEESMRTTRLRAEEVMPQFLDKASNAA
jgi:hypothetical protein